MLLGEGRPNTKRLKTNRNVRGLIKALSYEKDPRVRRNAARAAGQLGNLQAVDPLITALKDDSPEVCNVAEEALVQIGNVAVEPLLIELEGGECWRAASALGKIGDPRAVEPLIETLQNETVRGATVKALGDIRDARAVEPLIAVLNDSDEYIRRHAAEALGKIGDRRAISPLITALQDNDSDVRASAIKALAQIGDVQVANPLVDVLNCAESRDEYGLVSPMIAEALQRLGDSRAIDAFISVLICRKRCRSVTNTGKPGIPDDRAQHAAEALEEIGDARAVECLIATLSDIPPVAAAAEKALVQIGDAAVKQLITALENDNINGRRRAARALGQIGNTQAVGPLIEMLGVTEAKKRTGKLLKHMKETGQLPPGWTNAKPALEIEPSVACAVVEALGMIGDTRPVEAFRFIQDVTLYDNVRQAAAEALEKLGQR